MTDYEKPVVARLLIQNKTRPECDASYMIFAGDEFDFGRRDVANFFDGHPEPTISAHHLRFRCVVFDESEECNVTPMVYVQDLSTNGTSLARAGIDPGNGCFLMMKSQGDVLLNHGDTLHLTDTISIVFAVGKHDRDAKEELDPIRRAEIQAFANRYIVTPRKLGVGGNASVFIAIKHSSHRQVACKIVTLRLLRSNTSTSQQPLRLRQEYTQDDTEAAFEAHRIRKRETLTREYEVLKHLNHPNIIALEKVFCTTFNIFIFQELVTGGDLLSYIERRGALSEVEAAVIVRQLLKAVEYLHSHHVVHRDIKPENILMTSWREGARIVLTDFGQARRLNDSGIAMNVAAVSRMQSVVGTYGYTAPEVHKKGGQAARRTYGYTKAVDMWSVGCVAAAVLTDDVIFTKKDYARGPEDWDLALIDTGIIWREVSHTPKSFVKALLVIDEDKRLTAKQALIHSWFSNSHYHTELEDVYQKAISDWKPRKRAGCLVEHIDTGYVVHEQSKQEMVSKLAAETRSRHFPPVFSRPPVPKFVQAGFQSPPKRAHTPLPTVREDLHAGEVQAMQCALIAND